MGVTWKILRENSPIFDRKRHKQGEIIYVGMKTKNYNGI